MKEKNISSPEDEGDTTSGENEDSSSDESAEDLMMGDYNNNDEIPSYLDRELPGENSPREEIPVSGGTTFHDYLLEQLHLRELSDQDKHVAEYIIGNIDDNGYLQRTLPAISDDLMFQVDSTYGSKNWENFYKLFKTSIRPAWEHRTCRNA